MRIRFKTKVTGNYLEVFEAFDQKLFEYLKPPEQLAELLRFDGSAIGDVVHLQFKLPFKADWISKIVENQIAKDHCYFIDVGTTLPFGLTAWRHRHIVHEAGPNCIIEDDISFSSSHWVTGWLLFPGLWFTFFLRKRQYHKFFDSHINKSPEQ